MPVVTVCWRWGPRGCALVAFVVTTFFPVLPAVVYLSVLTENHFPRRCLVELTLKGPHAEIAPQ
eukprot:9309517-Pyramimonas_sp.AAC.1